MDIKNEKKDLQNSSIDELAPRVYEIGYTLLPTVREEDLDKEVESLVAHIIKLGGEKLTEEKPQLIDLAYEMSKIINNKREKFVQGHFGWLKFKMDGKNIDELDKIVEAVPDVLRYLIIKTVEENTIYSEKPFQTVADKTVKTSFKRVEKEEKKDISDEEVNDSKKVEEVSTEKVAETPELEKVDTDEKETETEDTTKKDDIKEEK